MANIYVIFNKKTRLPVFLTDDLVVVQTMESVGNPIKCIDTTTLGLKDEVFNVSRWKWEGDFETGQMVDAFRKNEFHVTEEEIDGKYRELLLRKYPIDKMLTLIIQAFPPKSYSPLSSAEEEFLALKIFVDSLELKKRKEIEFYQDSPVHKFETWDDIKKREEEVYKV